MTAPKTILVPLFLAGQAVLVHWTGTFERPPAKPDLSDFPARIGPWERISENPVDAATEAQLGADRLMNSMYLEQPQGESANLFVAWFQSQRAGASQPHSPQVCLPASGWTPESTGELTIATTAGAITVNRYVVADRSERAVILYWYQTSRRAIAGEWASKFWLVADAFRDHRQDTALVRIVVESRPGGDARATGTAADFARSAYPV